MKLIHSRESLFIGVASPRLLAYVCGRSAVDGRPVVVFALLNHRGGNARFSRVYRPFGGRKPVVW